MPNIDNEVAELIENMVGEMCCDFTAWFGHLPTDVTETEFISQGGPSCLATIQHAASVLLQADRRLPDEFYSLGEWVADFTARHPRPYTAARGYDET